MSNFIVRKVAVLGAGVMGAQIAAHFANAEVPVVLFDLPAKEGDPNGIVRRAIDGLKKLEPSPLASQDRAVYIDAANYEQHLAQLQGCDLIIEAIAEKMEWKDDLYRKIAPFIAPETLIASNTSGLSINRLAESLPAALRPRFCGIHFFNPPRHMHLVELIATQSTAPSLLDQLESWLVSRLGKGIVRALDTPNFVANRVGVFSMLAVMHHTERFGLGFDVVDALTGPQIGRPKSATYRTADVVGLDTLAHVIKTMHDTLPSEGLRADPWHAFYAAPIWLSALIGKGALGQKTRCGIFKKDGKAIKVLDLAAQNYRDAGDTKDMIAPEVISILQIKKPNERFTQLRASEHPQAQFLWAIFRDIFHYIAFHLADIADNARDVDFAMRWGFGWVQGPFETWQAAGWPAIAKAVQADIDAGKAMSQAPLPAWVFARQGVYALEGAYSVSGDCYKSRSTLPIYQRQIFPERVLGEKAMLGTTLWENDGVRLWTLAEVDSTVGILSVTSKMHTLGRAVIEGIQEALRRAEKDLKALVIWHEAPFAVGANLKEVSETIAAGNFALLEQHVGEFQKTSMLLKYAQVPVVAAVQGMALGGGCEFLMHAAKRVIALESYIGLVEAGVGLLPAGGGCKEFAIRAWQSAAKTGGKDPFEFIQPVFMTIALATVSTSATHAKELGFATDTDQIVFNPHELLYIAIREARALSDAGYYPKCSPREIKVAGRTGIANCEMLLANMLEGGTISPHDYAVSKAIATALCGGDIETGSLVDEAWLLSVERKLFIDLLKTEKTQQRIQHMLETGKPLRN